jgi:protein-S-isoprenylcysteine O-methyltransferase Ste14
MTVYGWLMFALWLSLVAYWALSGRTMQRTIGCRWIWWREIAVRLGFFALVVLALRAAVLRQAWPNAPPHLFNTSTPLALIGLVVCVLGIGLAILGRAYLDPNWVTRRSDRNDLELITTGPYAFVRHPIYSGLLLAIIGSAIGQSVLWVLPLIVYGPNFILAARREEKLLLEQFPERYPAYMRRTKMLLPFVL